VGISSSGIGSGLDVDSIVSQLMKAESAGLSKYDNKTAAYQSRLQALGQLGSAIGSFQGALSGLTSASTFRAVTASVGDKAILGGTATSEAAAGSYRVSVTQLAQSQSLNTAGNKSMSATIGSGVPTTLSFQFGSVSGGQFGTAGTALAASVATSGIASGSLSINGTAIATSGATKSAKLLAEAVNAQSAKTGVSATAGATSTGAALFAGFGTVTTTGTATYSLAVNGIELAAQPNPGGTAVSADSIDTLLAGNNPTTAALAAANITYSGSAADGDLQFFAADGANLTVSELVTGSVGGGLGAPANNDGSTVTSTSGVTLISAASNAIQVGGNAPGLAGLTAGTGGGYLGAGFTQDGSVSSGTVVLKAGDQSLQGIRDAINKANVGVSASIVSDGSAEPYRLVLTSNKTGANASMKIGVSGVDGADPDPAIAKLLGHDPAGAQALNQTSSAQSAQLSVNGIAVTSASNSVSDAIQGVTLTATQVGATTMTVAKDTATAQNNINGFVKAYNDLNTTIRGLTAYDPATKRGGALQGDATVRSIQTQLRQQLGGALAGSGKLNMLSQVGISFQKDGALAVDSTKLQKAMTDNFADVGALFAEIGNVSDGQIAFAGSSAATKAGTYDVNITQMASRGSLTGAAPLVASTVIGANTTWSVALNQTDPVSASRIQAVTIPPGSYNPAELAAMLRSAINGNKEFASSGDTVETEIDSTGHLNISSSRYGSTSNMSISALTGTALDGIFGSASPVTGKDVAGTIGGAAATGSGQTLSAPGGSAAEGMKLTINGGTTGERGTVTFSQGFAYRLNNLATTFLGKEGLITGKSDGLSVSIKSVATARDTFSERLTAMEKRYRAQFAALDTALASMQATSSYMTQQLAALASNNS
jgi:flagellar hook-associated protein 2